MSDSLLESWLVVALMNAVTACLFAAVAFAVSRSTRRPPLAHFLWLLVLLKLVTPPILRIPGTQLEDFHRLARPFLEPRSEARAGGKNDERIEIAASPPRLELATDESRPMESSAMFDETVEPGSAELEAERSPDAAAALPIPWDRRAIAVLSLSVVWLGGALLMLVVAASRILRFHRILRRAHAASAELAATAGRLGQRFGLRRTPEIVSIPARISPLVWAVGGPARIVLPSALLRELSPTQIETLIAHELIHVRRRDHWLRWLELVVVALFWWHPVAWWARRELRRAEEQCCDAWVQREFSNDVQEYARALLVTVDFLSSGSVAVPRTASGLGEGQLLRRRFEMILHAPLPHRLPMIFFGVLLVAAALSLPWAPGAAFGRNHGSSDDDSAGDAPSADDAPPVDVDPTAPEPVKPVAPQDSPVGPAKVVVRPPAGATPVAPVAPVAPARGGPSDVEDRLSRLEAQIAAMVAEMKALRRGGAPVPPRVPAGAKSVTFSPDGKSLIAVGPGRGTVKAIDGATGKTLWETQDVVTATNPEVNVESGDVLLRARGESARLDLRTGQIRAVNRVNLGADAAGKAASTEAQRQVERATLQAEMAALQQRIQEIHSRLNQIDEEAPDPDDPAGPAPAKARPAK